MLTVTVRRERGVQSRSFCGLPVWMILFSNNKLVLLMQLSYSDVKVQ